jgi:hypothetical protein
MGNVTLGKTRSKGGGGPMNISRNGNNYKNVEEVRICDSWHQTLHTLKLTVLAQDVALKLWIQ